MQPPLKKCLLALSSGALASLTVAPFNFWFVFPLSVLGFLYSLRDQPPVAAFRLGVIYGTCFWLGTLNWLFSVFPGGLPLVLFILFSLFHSAFAIVYVRLQTRSIPTWALVTMTACVWSGLEYIRSELWLLKFPWNTAGVAFGPSGLTSIIGVYGVSFMVVLAVIALAQRSKTSRLTGLILIIILTTLKIVNHTLPPIQIEQAIPVTLIQNESSTMSDHVDMTRDAQPEKGIIAWPEYALLYDPSVSNADTRTFNELTQNGSVLVAGIQNHARDGKSWENTALSFEDGKLTYAHVKNHTVHFFDDGKAGVTSSCIDTKFGKMGTPICFDGDYQDVYLNMVRSGAEFFISPTMDAIDWTERQHIDHSALVKQRAAETHRWIAVASSSGVTQIIDPLGRKTAMGPLMDSSILKGAISRETKRTLFVRYGWMFGWVILTLGILSTLASFFMKPITNSPEDVKNAP